MTPEEFKNEMKKIAESDLDPIEAHVMADDLMCELLVTLGYKDGVDIFNDMEKWYE